MGFREMFRENQRYGNLFHSTKYQTAKKHKKCSTWFAELCGQDFTLHQEKHYITHDPPSQCSATPPTLPPLANNVLTLPPLPRRSATVVSQHQDEHEHEPSLNTFSSSSPSQPTTTFFAHCLSGLFICLITTTPQQQQTTASTTIVQPRQESSVWRLSFLLGLSLVPVILEHTRGRFLTALAVGALASVLTAIFLRYNNDKNRLEYARIDAEYRRYELAVNAEKDVEMARLEKGHVRFDAAGMTAGLLESSGMSRAGSPE